MVLPFPFVLGLTIGQTGALMLSVHAPASPCPASALQLSATDFLSSSDPGQSVAAKRCAAPPVLALPPARKAGAGEEATQLELSGVFAPGQLDTQGSPARIRTREFLPNSPQLHTFEVQLPGERELFLRVLGEKIQTPLLIGEGAFMTTYILYNLLHPTTAQPPPTQGNAHQKR